MIAQFCLRLICGMSLMWCFMPRAQVTSGFFRIQMLVVMGLSVVAALAMGELTGVADAEAPLLSSSIGSGCAAAMTALAFLGSVFWTLERRKAGAIIAFLIAGLSTITLVGTTQLSTSSATWNSLHILSELSAAALLGAAMTGMLLGHWYLTAPTMSISPLSRLTAYLGVAGLVRIVLCSIALALAWNQLSGNTYQIWLGLRWLAGVFGPLAVFVMVWRILKYKNTQAATGVLFVGVILTFIGEMTAVLLYSELRMPL